ncbi:hypothetical protein OY671_012608, partial [Metschnikowia pulcherrima]
LRQDLRAGRRDAPRRHRCAGVSHAARQRPVPPRAGQSADEGPAQTLRARARSGAARAQDRPRVRLRVARGGVCRGLRHSESSALSTLTSQPAAGSEAARRPRQRVHADARGRLVALHARAAAKHVAHRGQTHRRVAGQSHQPDARGAL